MIVLSTDMLITFARYIISPRDYGKAVYWMRVAKRGRHFLCVNDLGHKSTLAVLKYLRSKGITVQEVQCSNHLTYT